MKTKNAKDVESAKHFACLSHDNLNQNNITLGESDAFKTQENDVDCCCSNTPVYEISYNNISRKWLVCNNCLDLEFFKTGIENKARIQR